MGVALAMAVAGLLATSGAAQASCSTGYGCLWEDIHYESNGDPNNHVDFYYNIPDMFYKFWPGYGPYAHVANSVSSAYNAGTGGDTVWFYYNQNCDGGPYDRYFSMYTGTGDSDFDNGTPTSWANDDTASVTFQSTLASCY